MVSVPMGFPNLLEIDSLLLSVILELNWIKTAIKNMEIAILDVIRK